MESGKRIKKIKVKDIIEDLDPISIKSFVLNYSKSDPAFEIAFKSHFISRIRTGLDESEKYRKILEEIVKPKNSSNPKLSSNQKKTVGIILKDFVLQMNDCLSTANYTEAYPLVKESLEKIAYIQNRYEIKDVSVDRCRVAFLEGLSVILDKELAPAFRSRLEAELKDLIKLSYFIPKKENLIALLNDKNVLIKEEKEGIIQDLIKKYKSKFNDINILKTIMQLSFPFDDVAASVLKSFDHEQIYKALIEMIDEGKFRFVDFYIENENVDYTYNKQLLSIHKFIEREEFENITQELRNVSREYYSVLQIQELGNALPQLYLKKEFDNIKAWIDIQSFGLQSQLYSKAERFEELLILLESKADVEWLKVFDKMLINEGYKKEIGKIYLKTIEHYLDNHLGSKTRDYLNKVFLHLYSIDQGYLVDKLKSNISDKYSYRVTLN